jgi:hypothetical protein
VPPIPGAQSRVIVRHRNDMGRAFRLVKAEFAVDGQPIRGPTRDGLPSIEEPIFDGHLVFGTHRLTATLTYEGNGFGVFGYLKGYRFKVRASELFQVRGKPVEVTVVGYERGDALTQFADRPAVRFDVAE